MKLSILLIEDNAIIAETTKILISELDNFFVKDITHTYQSTIQCLLQGNYDLALVDINLSESKNGFDVAEELNKRNIPYLFLTSYSDKQTLAKAIAYNPSGYVVKPVQKSNLFANLEILRMKYLEKDKITVLSGKIEVELRLSYIRYIQSVGNYCEVQTINDKTLVRCKLADFPEKNIKLKRVHKSYVVHEAMIDKKTKKQITLKCGTVIPVSPIYF